MPRLKNWIVAASLSIIALGVTQCSPSFLPLDPVRVEMDSQADFKGYRSFAWNSPPRTSSTPRPAWVDKEIQAEIERVLTEKGLVKASSNQADLLVAYDIAVEDRIIHQPVMRSGAGMEMLVYTVRRGALLISFIDPKNKRVVWNGLTGGEVEEQPSLEASRPRIRRAVEMILEKFPPS